MLAATRRCIYLRQRVCKRGMVNGVCFTFAPILGLNGFNYRRFESSHCKKLYRRQFILILPFVELDGKNEV